MSVSMVWSIGDGGVVLEIRLTTEELLRIEEHEENVHAFTIENQGLELGEIIDTGKLI